MNVGCALVLAIRTIEKLFAGLRGRGEFVTGSLSSISPYISITRSVRSQSTPVKMISKAVKEWCAASGTDALYIDPGSPCQNGIVESFNGRLRDELPSSEIFATLDEARLLVDRWRLHYNHRRIQRALGKLTPAAFAATCLALPPLRQAWRRRLPSSNSH